MYWLRIVGSLACVKYSDKYILKIDTERIKCISTIVFLIAEGYVSSQLVSWLRE